VGSTFSSLLLSFLRAFDTHYTTFNLTQIFLCIP
jgi:hypothetical protein